ncbi:MAG: N-formylglutamate amidohydrolase [Rhodospirillales bacterium]|nr:N-formylglutamate amidohydrolase [Rhodospirillales bacterium]
MSVFSIEKPQNPLPLVFDSPHSGDRYPNDFDFACDRLTLESAEDKYVEDLFAAAPHHGITFLHAHFPRSYIDVNRAAEDIDTELLSEEWSGPFEIAPSSRSHAGIGLIRRLVRPGVPVYNRSLSTEEILHRLNTCYHPYHDALEALINETHYNFGQVWHINCHSMPSTSAYPRHGIGLVGNRAKPVDFVLGDRDGTACDPDFTRALRDFLKGLGYTVSINDPFKGVELVEKYSSPAAGFHSLQLEINKSLYMDEDTLEKTSNYNALKNDLEKMIQFCASYVESRLTTLAAD